MTDHTHVGARCRTVQHINTHEGALRRDTYGTIRYEVDNLDRHLVFVDWDNGISVAVFPQEIEIVPAYERLAA
jgi:hypothetical protein